MRYQGIIKASNADGIGWRTVLFVSGCEHQCRGCHNKESWNKDSGEVFSNETLNLIIKELKRPEISGLTLSGGDPLALYNREEIEKLCKTIKTIFPNKTIWLYTGYDWEDIRELALLKYVDVVVDGKFILEQRDITLPFRGSPNQRIIDVKKSLQENSIVLYNLPNS